MCTCVAQKIVCVRGGSRACVRDKCLLLLLFHTYVVNFKYYKIGDDRWSSTYYNFSFFHYTLHNNAVEFSHYYLIEMERKLFVMCLLLSSSMVAQTTIIII